MFKIFLLSYLAWVAKLWLKFLWIICQKLLHHHHQQHFAHHQETMNKFSAKCLWGEFNFFFGIIEIICKIWNMLEEDWKASE
jgi:hypothetical protein